MSVSSLFGGLTVVPPMLPDYHVCDNIYGSDLKITDCGQARLNLLEQVTAGLYHTYATGTSRNFPITASSGMCFRPDGWLIFQCLQPIIGDCQIIVEAAGPTVPRALNVDPVTLGNMAYWVISRCVIATNGLGGFVTNGLQAMQEYSTDLGQDPRVNYRTVKPLILLENALMY